MHCEPTQMVLHVEVAVVEIKLVIAHRGSDFRTVLGQHEVGNLQIASFATDMQPLLILSDK